MDSRKFFLFLSLLTTRTPGLQRARHCTRRAKNAEGRGVLLLGYVLLIGTTRYTKVSFAFEVLMIKFHHLVQKL